MNFLRMWPFKKKGDVESRIAEIDNTIKNSFQRVRDDVGNVNSWLNYFYSQETERQGAMENLQAQVSHLSKAAPQEIPDMGGALVRLKKVEEKVGQLGVSVHAVEPVISRITELNSRVNLVEDAQKSMKDNVFERLRDIAARLDKVEQARTMTALNLREKIVKKVARRSKEYIKNLLLSAINKYGQLSAIQLREMIVEEQGLCSKSTFYRLLEEIEAEDKVEMIAQGKEKAYLPKITAKH
jgi:hypothetical protein